MTNKYDTRFFEWVNLTARRSALAILPLVKEQVLLSTILDVGCGQGAWLQAWAQLGLTDSYGLDGDHVARESLLIPQDSFQAVDLRKPWSVQQRYDLVQSLEVAEHLPPDSAETFVQCLCTCGDVVLFSAAQPGQGGEGHINERPPSYWARLFASHGYSAFDSIRPLVTENKLIDPWYRFNTVLYANAAGAVRLNPMARSCRVERLSELDRGGDWPWHLRRALLRPLPEPVVTFLSRLRYRILTSYHASGDS